MLQPPTSSLRRELSDPRWMMTHKTRYGCWTCRARHKKCDKAHPVCQTCRSLGITCFSGPETPEWMKKEGKRSEMLREIKREIQTSGTSRRERKRVHTIKHGTDQKLLDGQSIFSLQGDEVLSPSESVGTHQTPRFSALTSPSKTPAALHAIDGATSLAFLHDSQEKDTFADFYAQNAVFEVDFITKYLDYVFPFLFPFYKPAIFETGRSWLLSLLSRSRIALHSTLSLTAYFFTTALNDAYGSSYADCNDQIWSRLSGQAHECFDNMQNEVRDLIASDVTSTAVEKAQMMESIIQVVVFESLIGKSAGWNLHLTASITLLEQLLQSQASDRSKMLAALLSLGPPVWYKVENDSYIWSPDQAGLRFFAALLVVADIMASTATRREPRLAKYHADVLGDDDGAPVLGFTRIRLSSVMGCQNSIMVAIGEIASIDSWRSTAIESSDFPPEMLDQAGGINNRLEYVRSSLICDVLESSSSDCSNLAFQSFAARATAKSPCALASTIWTYAAQVYLATIVGAGIASGVKIDEHISALLQLTQRVKLEHLRTLAWPLCVAGCFASSDQRAELRNMFAARTELELIGSLGVSWQILQKVWDVRSKDQESFRDLASCLNIFKEPVLLI